MNYSAELSELIEEFQAIDDKMERLEMVFDLADEVNLLPLEDWNDATRVHGCQSEAQSVRKRRREGGGHRDYNP